jgi:hypothetical protein
LATVDFPQIVDFILGQTGKEKLSVIGHSMGSSALIAALSVFEEVSLFSFIRPLPKFYAVES